MTSIRLSSLVVRICRASFSNSLVICAAVRTSSLVEIGLLIIAS